MTLLFNLSYQFIRAFFCKIESNFTFDLVRLFILLFNLEKCSIGPSGISCGLCRTLAYFAYFLAVRSSSVTCRNNMHVSIMFIIRFLLSKNQCEYLQIIKLVNTLKAISLGRYYHGRLRYLKYAGPQRTIQAILFQITQGSVKSGTFGEKYISLSPP